MQIIPAIDIIEGKCVRLTEGDYAQKKIYNEDPLEVAKAFEGIGLMRLHLVDLDGAKAGQVVNWKVLEKIYQRGAAKMIGISNVNLRQMEMLVEAASVKPMFVQNRCYAARGWDKDVREFCHKNKIHYQGFSLLTANPQIVQSRAVAALATKYKTAPEQIIFRFCHQIGIIPLTGTSDENHMKADLGIFDFELEGEEMRLVAALQ